MYICKLTISNLFMTRIINISLNVPESYQIEELTRLLTEYGEQLIAHNTAASTIHKHRPSMDFLNKFTLPSKITEKQLVNEYLEEKYNL